MIKHIFFSAVTLWSVAAVSSVQADIISTVYVEANALNFTCTSLTSDETAEHNVLLLHGFPMSRFWYLPLLQSWANSSTTTTPALINALACDLRGYSPGASPDSIDEYDYDILASDVWALAEAVNFTDFHLVGHDHGALLGWVVASQAETMTAAPTTRLLSYTAMSVPNVDRMAASLCSEDEINEDQVVASNYFNHFAIPDSASINNNSLTSVFAGFGLPVESPEQFQKQLWWYNGSIPQYVPLPRIVDDSEVPPELVLVQLTRQAIPLDPRPCIPREKEVGKISIPVLLVCGETDPFLLCSLPSVTPSEDLVPDYTYFGASTCGHDFFAEGDCTDPAASQEVMDVITDFILKANDVPTTQSTSGAETYSSIAALVTVLLALEWG